MFKRNWNQQYCGFHVRWKIPYRVNGLRIKYGIATQCRYAARDFSTDMKSTVQDAHTRMGLENCPYAYGSSHTRTGYPIRVLWISCPLKNPVQSKCIAYEIWDSYAVQVRSTGFFNGHEIHSMGQNTRTVRNTALNSKWGWPCMGPSSKLWSVLSLQDLQCSDNS